MQSIRLKRVGRRNAPMFRIVVMPKHRAPSGKVQEIVGHYNPRKKPKEISLKEERVAYWLDNGAQPTDTVWNLFVEAGVVSGDKRNVTHITDNRTERMQEAETEAKAAAEEAKAKAEEKKQAEATEAEAAEEKEEESEDAAEEKEEETKDVGASGGSPEEEETQEEPTAEEQNEDKEDTDEKGASEEADDTSNDDAKEKPSEEEDKKDDSDEE